MKNIFSKEGIDYSQLPPESLKFGNLKLDNLIFDCDKKIEEEREKKRILKEMEDWKEENELKFVFIKDMDTFMNPDNIKNVIHDINDIIHLDGTPIIEKIYTYSWAMLLYNFKPWFKLYGKSLYRTKFGWFVKSNKWPTTYRADGLFDALNYMYKCRKHNN